MSWYEKAMERKSVDRQTWVCECSRSERRRGQTSIGTSRGLSAPVSVGQDEILWLMSASTGCSHPIPCNLQLLQSLSVQRVP